MQATPNPAASGFRSALAEALEKLGQRFENDLDLARREQSERLNQTIRRLRQSDGEKAWAESLLDGASAFALRCLVAAVEGDRLRLLAWRGQTTGDAPAPIPLAEAAAFAGAAHSAEPVVALREARELSPALYRFLGNPKGGKIFLFPVISGRRVAAILSADADAEAREPESNCLEILAATAGAALPGSQTAWTPEGLVGIENAPAAKAPNRWEELPAAEQAVHLKAQRMARIRVAALVLYHHEAVIEGRKNRDLYDRLREQIDAGRAEFRTNFLETCGSMVDYFHLELLGRIANNDAELLGAVYPGPMLA